jgi:hypothetical protein
MTEIEIDKDKLIEYLQKRCTELWDENERLKFISFCEKQNIKKE